MCVMLWAMLPEIKAMMMMMMIKSLFRVLSRSQTSQRHVVDLSEICLGQTFCSRLVVEMVTDKSPTR